MAMLSFCVDVASRRKKANIKKKVKIMRSKMVSKNFMHVTQHDSE